MAARLNARHSESCIARIRTSQLINRLQQHAFGKTELTRTQVDAAKFLIERTLARANSPVDLNIDGDLKIEVDFVGGG